LKITKTIGFHSVSLSTKSVATLGASPGEARTRKH